MRGYGALCLALSIGIQLHCMEKEDEKKHLLHSAPCCLFKGEYSSIDKSDPQSHILKLNISPHARDVRNGDTLLHAKIRYGDKLKISLKRLLAKGFSLEAKNNDGKTPADLLQHMLLRAEINSLEHNRLKLYADIIMSQGQPIFEKKKPNCIKAFFCCLCWRK